MNAAPFSRALALCLALGSLAQSRAELDAAGARRLLADRQNAVVSVRGVLKFQPVVNGRPMSAERELPVDTTGTVVDASGAVVVCGFQLNPIGALIKKPIRTEVRGQAVEYELKTRLLNLRYGLPDRSECPARVLAEDEDLGLLVLVPEPKPDGPAPTFAPVRLDHSARAAAFTAYLVLERGVLTFRDALLLDGGMVGAVLTEPRPFYVQDSQRPHVFLGSPFYDLAGRLLGVGSLSLHPPADLASGRMDSWPVAVIVPTAEVQQFVRRALKHAETAPPAPPPLAAAERFDALPPETAQRVLRACADAVVTVEGTVKYNCGRCAEEHENEVDLVGTVLDARGLVVVPGGSEVSGTKYLEQNLRYSLADRTELPAHIVLEDGDLGLAVLAPVKPPETTDVFHPLPLAADTQAELFDPVLVLSRLGKDHRHLPALNPARITARITEPRPFYQLNLNTAGPFNYGQPILLPDGRLLGIVAQQPESDGQAGTPPLPGIEARLFQPDDSHVVPVAALSELLRQARTAQAKAKSAGATPER